MTWQAALKPPPAVYLPAKHVVTKGANTSATLVSRLGCLGAVLEVGTLQWTWNFSQLSAVSASAWFRGPRRQRQGFVWTGAGSLPSPLSGCIYTAEAERR